MRKTKTRKTKTKPKVEEAEPIPKLSDRQLKFVENFMANGGNASKAYSDAGYSTKGARQSAHELLTNPYIQAVLAERRNKIMERWEITEDRITQRFATMAFTTMQDVMKLDSYYGGFDLKHWAAMNPLHAGAIKSLTETRGESTSHSIAMHDPDKALHALVKYLNLYPNQAGNKNAKAGSNNDRDLQEDAIRRLREKFGFPIEPRDSEANDSSPGGDGR